MTAGPPLIVRLAEEGDSGCAIQYRTMSGVAQLMVGRASNEVSELLGRLFAVCPAAQRLAGRLATAAASGTLVTREERYAMRRATMLETVREHALRITLGWARTLGVMPDHAVAADLNRRTRSGWTAELGFLIEQAVFGMSPVRWLALDAAGIARWARSGDTLAAAMVSRELGRAELHMLPPPAEGSLLARFIHAGAPAIGENRGVAAAHLARVTDLAQLVCALAAGRMRAGDVRVHQAPGRATVRVACSRGTLVHRVRMTGSQVAAYKIESPTDRTFALDGAGQAWLDKAAAMPLEARETAARAVLEALDPCVEYRVEFA